jgi:pimeloyl-ACP methyl ester carboxylesterase
MSDDPLAYESTGEGPPILFIHGLTFTRQTWAPIVERLRDRFQCVAVDLPGHGDSTGSGADPHTVCARIHASATATGLDKPLVVGHSAGALTATGYATLYPTSGVVNVDQTLAVQQFARFVQQLADALRGPDFDRAFTPFRSSMGVDQLPEPERSRVVGTQRTKQSVVLDHWTRPLATQPLELQAEINGLLDAVTVPYLLLAGRPVSEDDRNLLLAHIPSAQIEQWPGNGHMVHLAEPDRFAERVARFRAGSR